MLVSSENVVYIYNNYIVVAWIRRCRDVEISSKALAMIIFGSTIRSYIDIVKIAFLDSQKFDFIQFYNFSVFELKLSVQIRT